MYVRYHCAWLSYCSIEELSSLFTSRQSFLLKCTVIYLKGRGVFQWRSQGLEVKVGTGSLEDGSPPVGCRGRAPVGVEAPRSQICIYTICSGQTRFRNVFIEDIRCTFRLMRSLLLPHHTPPKNYSNLCKSHDPPGRGRVGTCPPVPHDVFYIKLNQFYFIKYK